MGGFDAAGDGEKFHLGYPRRGPRGQVRQAPSTLGRHRRGRLQQRQASDDPLMLASYSQMKAAAAEDNKQFLSLRPEAPKDPLAIDARKRAAAF